MQGRRSTSAFAYAGRLLDRDASRRRGRFHFAEATVRAFAEDRHELGEQARRPAAGRRHDQHYVADRGNERHAAFVRKGQRAGWLGGGCFAGRAEHRRARRRATLIPLERRSAFAGVELAPALPSAGEQASRERPLAQIDGGSGAGCASGEERALSRFRSRPCVRSGAGLLRGVRIASVGAKRDVRKPCLRRGLEGRR